MNIIMLLIVMVFPNISYSADANLGEQVNVLEDYFQRTGAKKLVMELCDEVDINSPKYCKTISNKKHIVFYPPTKSENAYDSKYVYQKQVIGRGKYYNHDEYVEVLTPDGHHTYVLDKMTKDLKFTYHNDGAQIYFEFDNQNEDNTSYYVFDDLTIRDGNADNCRNPRAFRITKTNAKFNRYNMILHYFDTHKDVNAIYIQQCIGNGNTKDTQCTKLDPNRTVIYRKYMPLLTPKYIGQTPEYTYVTTKQISVTLGDTSVEIMKPDPERGENCFTVLADFQYIQGAYGVDARGFDSSAKDGETTCFRFYKLTTN